MSSTADKAARKPAATKPADPKTVCGHRNAEGQRDCTKPRDPSRNRPTGCVQHEKEYAALRNSRRVKAAAKPTAKKVTTAPKSKVTKPAKVIRLPKRPARGVVVPLKADEQPLAAFEVQTDEPKG
jgi:hypothetical protein